MENNSSFVLCAVPYYAMLFENAVDNVYLSEGHWFV